MTSTYVTALSSLDYLGIFVFAVSGAIVAAEKKLDFLTFSFLAVVTGVGGGTVRDLLIGAPVFWVRENWLLVICIVAALLVWFAPKAWWRGRSLVWADAIGIAVYATYGAAKAVGWGVAPVPAAAMGVLTACFGGILRDVLAGAPSVLLRQEFYVTAALASASSMVVLMLAGIGAFVAAAVAASLGFGLRAAAIVRGWSLPAYRG